MNPFLEKLGITVIFDIGKQLVLAIPRAIQGWRFRRFFGEDATHGDRIIGVLDPVTHPQTPPNGNRYVKQFLGRRANQPLVGPNHVLGICSVRVVSYASGLFAKFRPKKPLAFDIDYNVAAKWDASFFSFGSSDSNIKTLDIETLAQQKFYSTVTTSLGRRVFQVGNRTFDISPSHDHGILLRMRNPNHPEHVLFVCAGLGEWGTSGAAYYLFHNWSALCWKHGRADFCKVIQVPHQNDESATEVFSLP
jgi:hypothetical protein